MKYPIVLNFNKKNIDFIDSINLFDSTVKVIKFNLYKRNYWREQLY